MGGVEVHVPLSNRSPIPSKVGLVSLERDELDSMN